MAKSRLYGWNGEMTERPLSGQALIVFNGIRGHKDEMKTGHEWAELIGERLATRQDPYRVVLYYILILKNRGVIKTNEFDINAVTRNGDVKHGITVKTDARVEERHVVSDVPIVQGPPIDGVSPDDAVPGSEPTGAVVEAEDDDEGDEDDDLGDEDAADGNDEVNA